MLKCSQCGCDLFRVIGDWIGGVSIICGHCGAAMVWVQMDWKATAFKVPA